jgi:HAD superfamily hydrolase (TIGR01484 family)
MKPLATCPASELRAIRAVLTDIDDTLTTHGRLPPEAYQALHDLRAAGLIVIPVTGRPAGWCDHIARMWPADAVVGENGAFYFRYHDAERRMERVYAQDARTRAVNSARLMAIARKVLSDFPGTAIASDQAYREIDVAIDFREDVPPLPRETAFAIAKAFEAEGAVAKVSSIHVNAWFGDHDKRGMSLKLLQALGAETAAYAGDSPNDEPMFAHFPLSVGVANVAPFAQSMTHLPRYIASKEGGAGFAEFAAMLLAARGK